MILLEWDLEKIESNLYVVNFEGGYASDLYGSWVSLEKAREIGLKIEISGQKLKIEIPSGVIMNGSYASILNETSISVRLAAKIKDSVLENESIEYVNNESEVTINGADETWKVESNDKKDSAKIYRQGGNAHGTKPGELKVVKRINGKDIGIPDVTFELKRADNKNIIIRGKDKGNKIDIKTDKDGIAGIKGLQLGEYTIKEKSAPEWINFKSEEAIEKKFEIKSSDKEGTLLEISNEKKKRSIAVEKKWENISGDKPSIKIQLLKNGIAEGEELELKNGESSYIWKDLDHSDDYGTENKYSVKEVGESDGKIQLENDWYSVGLSGDMDSGFKILNKRDELPEPVEPKTRNILIEKHWKDNKGKEIDAPVDAIEVELYKNGKASGEKSILDNSNNWMHEFDNLDYYETDKETEIEYTVKEVGEEGGKIKIENKWYKVELSGDMSNGFVLENKELKPWIPIEPALRKISVSKDWKDDKGNKIDAAVESIEVELYKNGVSTGTKKELNESNNWSVEFENLRYSDSLGLAEHNYTVKEVGEESGKIKLDGKWYKVDVSGDMKQGYKIENIQLKPNDPDKPSKPSKPSKQNSIVRIKFEKEWLDNTGKERKAPVDKIEVELYRDGVATGDKKELNDSNNWSSKFEALKYNYDSGREEYKYTIKEVGEEDGYIQFANKWYESSINDYKKTSFIITNKEVDKFMNPSHISKDIKVVKKWEDKSGKTIKPAVDSIEVELYKNGEATGIIKELNKDNDWSVKFEKIKLLESSSGKKIDYTIKELGEEKGKIDINGSLFDVNISGDIKEGFEITNKESGEDQAGSETPTKNNIKNSSSDGSNSSRNSKSLPKTGEAIYPKMYAVALATSGTVLFLIGYMRKKNEKVK